MISDWVNNKKSKSPSESQSANATLWTSVFKVTSIQGVVPSRYSSPLGFFSKRCWRPMQLPPKGWHQDSPWTVKQLVKIQKIHNSNLPAGYILKAASPKCLTSARNVSGLINPLMSDLKMSTLFKDYDHWTSHRASSSSQSLTAQRWFEDAQNHTNQQSESIKSEDCLSWSFELPSCNQSVNLEPDFKPICLAYSSVVTNSSKLRTRRCPVSTALDNLRMWHQEVISKPQ